MKAIFEGKVVYHKETKGAVNSHNHTFIFEDRDGNLFVWTRSLGAHATVYKIADLVMLEGDVVSIITLKDDRQLTTVTKCKEKRS